MSYLKPGSAVLATLRIAGLQRSLRRIGMRVRLEVKRTPIRSLSHLNLRLIH